MMFVVGIGLGCIMQVIVLIAQNAVPAEDIGAATSTNNYFREVSASLGVATFGSIFSANLSQNLTEVFTSAGATADQAGSAGASLDPATLATLPAPVRAGVVNAYADALAPVFWYLVPFLLVALALALFVEQIPLSDVAGMVARGEAVSAGTPVAGAAARGTDLANTTADDDLVSVTSPGADLSKTGGVATVDRPDDGPGDHHA